MKPVIGILGGMGPRATVRFEQLLIERLSGSDQHLPTIITINDGSIPDRSDFVLGKGADPVPRMQRNVTALEQLGATLVCIPCNTACVPIIFDRLTTTAQLVNLPTEVEAALIHSTMQRVCILATAGTIATNVYQQACENAGVEACVPDALTQKQLSGCIALVKRGRIHSAIRLATQVAQFVQASGCDAVILGCTELPLITAALIPPDCQSVDTLEVLADACSNYVNQGDHYDARPIYT